MKKKILVIDDERAVRNAFMLTFENTDYEINTAESGMEGIEKIKRNAYNLVFLDLKMPHMDGVETLTYIRDYDKNLMVYIFTAFHQDFFVELEKASKKGLNFEIVQKPLDGDQLKTLVDNLLHN